MVGAFTFFRIYEERAKLLAEFYRRAVVTSKAIQLAVEQALRDESFSDVEQLFSTLVVKQTDIVRIRLLDASLRPLVDSNLLPAYEGPPPERLRRVIETRESDHIGHRWEKFRLHSDLIPLGFREAAVERVLEVVHLATGLEKEDRDVVYEVGLPLAGFFFTLALLIGFVLQREVFQPLGHLMQGIQRLGQGQPGPPVPIKRRDEFGRVAESLNEMGEHLDKARRELLAEVERSLDLGRHLRRAETLSAVGKLCSSIAHEVGTPLNVIGGRAELIQQVLPPTGPLREHVEVIIAQLDRIAKIIRSLLDPLRSPKPDIQPVALATVLEGLLPLLRHTAKRRGVSLTASVPPDVPPVQADPGRLQQVLINLLTNALEATSPGGRVELKAWRLNSGAEPGIAISVGDTGSGIAPELLPRIFEPFFTTKVSERGTGLGLAICRDIVKEHGGEISVESKAGVGTTVTVILPEVRGDQR